MMSERIVIYNIPKKLIICSSLTLLIGFSKEVYQFSYRDYFGYADMLYNVYGVIIFVIIFSIKFKTIN